VASINSVLITRHNHWSQYSFVSTIDKTKTNKKE